MVNNPSRTSLQSGEVSVGVACEYHIGSDELHKHPGRVLAFSTNAPANSILNIRKFRYEDFGDVLVAATGNGEIWEGDAAPNATGNIWNGAASVTGRSKTAIPHFNAFADRWIVCNGVDENLLREGAVVPGTSSNYRTLGMKPAIGQTKANRQTVQGTIGFADSNSGDWTDGDNASNSDDDYALGQTSDIQTKIQTYTFSTDIVAIDRVLRVKHVGFGAGKSSLTTDMRRDVLGGSFGEVPTGGSLDGIDLGRYKIEFSINDGFTFSTLFDSTSSYSETTSTAALDDSLDFGASSLIVKVSLIGQAGSISMRLFNIYIDNGGQIQRTIQVGIEYFVTEYYIDSDGAQHESIHTHLTEEDSSPDTAAGTQAWAMDITLPTAAANTFTTGYRIYRSIDETSGGFPFMYRIGQVALDDVLVKNGVNTFVDDFESSLTSASDKTDLFNFITILFFNGANIDFAIQNAPPRAKMSINYQGSVVYLPKDKPRTLWYSLPTSVSANAAEQVPAPYYLEFLTAENDTVVSAALTNGGRSLVVYFDSYTMIVHYLPQAGDGGTFDNRVSDYVSQQRGAAGVHTTTTFTPEDGASTIAASVDALGMWVTDGVGLIRNVSKDFDWEGTFKGIDLTTAMLVNNPEMRRLEFIYYDGDKWKDLHFFYGEQKPNGQPKITGPHPAGYRCKTYTKVGSDWVGWSGDASTTGAVWAERIGGIDSSNGYDADGNIPYQVETKDEYAFGLSDSALLTYIYPKFNERALSDKIITVKATCSRDGRATPVIISKDYNLLKGKKVFYNKFADRFRILFEDISTSALPALVGLEYVTRQLNAEGTQGGN